MEMDIKEKAEMKKRVGIIILMAIGGLLSIFLIFRYAPSLYVHYHEKSVAYPTNGAFYCKELDAYLFFSSECITLKTADGSDEKIYVHPAGRFCTNNGINMWYSWRAEEKCIKIEIISFPTANKEAVFYFFECDMAEGHGSLLCPPEH